MKMQPAPVKLQIDPLHDDKIKACSGKTSARSGKIQRLVTPNNDEIAARSGKTSARPGKTSARSGKSQRPLKPNND